jgi:peptide methionine sulfoxide reductase MsrA
MKAHLLLILSLTSSASAYTTPKPNNAAGSNNINTVSHRRVFLFNIASAATMATIPNIAAASAAVDDNLQNVYFGAGCFWHVQHEFVLAERSILGRKDDELTSLTGYAGGKSDSEGRVCYHNFQSIADYGKLGHGEVVGLSIPDSKIEDFAVEYFKLFNDKGERADPMDKGGEYRSLLGLPGGSKHSAYPQVEAAGKARGMTLVDGKGNDPDTLGKRLVYVYDSNKFPFYQAEFYHQYHNDFLTPAYGKEYNNLAEHALKDGRIKITGCPDRV